jgi:undecaprenyl-diphosphatase
LVTAGLAVLVICIGLARMYLGVHFLSDVLAGYVVGIAWTAVVVRSLCMLSQ